MGRGGVERICFYLDHADGYKDDGYLTIPDEVRRAPYGMAIYEKAPDEVARRKEVARKAWRMLVDKFFKDTPGDPRDRMYGEDFYPSWMQLAVHPAVFEKLMWFFGNQEKHRYPSQESNLPGESEKYEDKITTKFLVEFTEFAWRFDDSRDKRIRGRESEDVMAMFAAARPRVIRIMQNVGNLWVFVRDPCLMAKLNSASRAMLKELALRRYDKVRWATLEEAYTSGHSLAALVLLTASTYRVTVARQKKSERNERREQDVIRAREEREREIDEARRLKKEAEERLKELRRAKA